MKYIFVYNANSGFVNSMLNIGHKAISPKTYECRLCSMTYGVLSEKEEWKKFRESSNDELEFFHKDEFEKKYREKRECPIILKVGDDNRLDEFISREDLNKMESVDELIEKLPDS